MPLGTCIAASASYACAHEGVSYHAKVGAILKAQPIRWKDQLVAHVHPAHCITVKCVHIKSPERSHEWHRVATIDKIRAELDMMCRQLIPPVSKTTLHGLKDTCTPTPVFTGGGGTIVAPPLSESLFSTRAHISMKMNGAFAVATLVIGQNPSTAQSDLEHATQDVVLVHQVEGASVEACASSVRMAPESMKSPMADSRALLFRVHL
mmetsp:Transcript_120763/g.225744  ORF Transcript_120763/g.225744 Transcript_120763/m.225744 type:complete len:207 (-) Transcript_120763:290-910(-)